jgi:hypothetical protein
MQHVAHKSRNEIKLIIVLNFWALQFSIVNAKYFAKCGERNSKLSFLMLLSYAGSWLSHNIRWCKFSVMSRNQVWNPFEITFHYDICITYIIITHKKCGPMWREIKLSWMASFTQSYLIKLCVAHCQMKGLVVKYIVLNL